MLVAGQGRMLELWVFDGEYWYLKIFFIAVLEVVFILFRHADRGAVLMMSALRQVWHTSASETATTE